MGRHGRVHSVRWLPAALLLALASGSHAATNEDVSACIDVLTVAVPDMSHEMLERKLRPVIEACNRVIANPGRNTTIADQSRDSDLERGLSGRGLAHQLLGEFQLAIADYSAVLKSQSPKDAQAARIRQDRGVHLGR